MAKNDGKSVGEILVGKKASIKDAPLEPGSPGWDDMMELAWEEIQKKAQRNIPGFKTIKKLLGSREYDK